MIQGLAATEYGKVLEREHDKITRTCSAKFGISTANDNAIVEMEAQAIFINSFVEW